MLNATEIARMSSSDKIGEAMRRSLPHLPEGAKAVVESMLSPGSLALIAGTIAVWAGSHFFGVGEVVDVILLGVGAIALGFSIFEGASELYDFALGAYNARTDADLERAGRHFARAVVILGISTIQAILMRGQGRSVVARGRPKVYERLAVAEPPASASELRLARPRSLPGGRLGQTDAFGAIKISRSQPIGEQRITLYHELVHRYFSPRLGPFLKFRAELRMSGYVRSALLRYIEEALAEGYGQLRVHGLAQAIEAWRFPMQGGYVVVSQLIAEGQALGAIALGGITFQVSIALGEMPDE